jgi:hypothetical protein
MLTLPFHSHPFPSLQLREFLERLWTDSYRHHPQLANLCTRLDYNGFFSSSFSSSS